MYDNEILDTCDKCNHSNTKSIIKCDACKKVITGDYIEFTGSSPGHGNYNTWHYCSLPCLKEHNEKGSYRPDDFNYSEYQIELPKNLIKELLQ